MESKEEAAVERQKLVPDDTENEPDDDIAPSSISNIIGGTSSSATVSSAAERSRNNNSAGDAATASKSGANPQQPQQTPISPVLSHKIFSSGETSRTHNSSNCSVGRGGGSGVGHMDVGGGSGAGVSHSNASRLIYVNERVGKQLDAKPSQHPIEYKTKARKMQRDDHPDAMSIPQPTSSHPYPNPQSTSQSLSSSTQSISNRTAIPATLEPNVTITTASIATHAASPASSSNTAADATSAPDAAIGGGKSVAFGGGGNGNAAATIAAAASASTSSHNNSTALPSSITFEQRQLKHHSFVSEVPDVRKMERALLGLLEDFHSGKLKAFGSGCTMDQMTDIREQQEGLAKLHFELGAGGDPLNAAGDRNDLNAQANMTQLVAKLENLSMSIERLHSSNTNM